MIFYESLSDNKSPLVSRTLHSILAVLNNAIVWMVSTRPPTSKSSIPFNNPLATAPKAQIPFGIIVTFMFHNLFDSLARSSYLFFFSQSFSSIQWSAGAAKSTIFEVLFSLLIITRSGLLTEIRRSVWISKPNRSLCVLFSRTGAGLCIYHMFVWSNLNFLHISHYITLPTQSCLVLNSFCANLLHLVIMWLMVSSLSLHRLHLLFCWVLSILALIWLVLTVLFFLLRRDSLSLLKFPFHSHFQVLSCEMLFISRLKRPYSCFPSHFCFLFIVLLLSIVLSVSFLMAGMSPPLCFSI